MRLRLALVLAVLAGAPPAAAPQSPNPQEPSAEEAGRSLRFTFVDVEGGAATLIVTPAGESILIDSGNPGERDAGRIAEAARAAGITEISHYVTTHWHSDHVGGIGPLSRLLPIRAVYGHALPDPLPNDINPELVAAWQAVSAAPVFLSAGDTITLRGRRGTPTPRLRVLAADGLVDGEQPGAPAVFTCDKGHQARPEDTSDNARSLALHLTFGTFDLFAGGDLTWNIEHKLVCPRRVAPQVDAYLVNHHGLDSSNNPLLVEALAPEVAIVNNGPRKGAEPETMALLVKQLRDVGVFQLHRNVRAGAVNAEAARLANHEEACAGHPLMMRVAPDGRRIVVSNPSRQMDRVFSAR